MVFKVKTMSIGVVALCMLIGACIAVQLLSSAPEAGHAILEKTDHAVVAKSGRSGAAGKLASIATVDPLASPAKWTDPYAVQSNLASSLGHEEQLLPEDATQATAIKAAQNRLEKLLRYPPYDPEYAAAAGELRQIAREALARWGQSSTSLEFQRFALVAAERLNYFEGLANEMWKYAIAATAKDPAMTVEKCAARELLRASEQSPRAARAYARKIIEMAPHSPEALQAHFQLGRIYSRDSRKVALSFMHFMEAAKTDERQIRYLAHQGAYNAANVAADQPRLAEALTALLSDELLKLQERPLYLLKRANCYFAMKQYEKTLADCRTIRSEYPQSSQAVPAAKLEQKLKSAVFGTIP